MDVRRALNLLARVHPKSPSTSPTNASQGGIPELTEILRRELDMLAARRFRRTRSAATVSIFLEPVAGIAQDSFCVGVLRAGNGLMGVINE
jgi:hypothetical protein